MLFSRDCQYLRDLHMHEPRHTKFPRIGSTNCGHGELSVRMADEFDLWVMTSSQSPSPHRQEMIPRQ